MLLFQIIAIMAVTGASVWYANRDRGVPVVAIICLLFLAFWSGVANHTRFGRYVYAVGSNPEAARRAGIDVKRIRVIVFMISGFMAGVGGIVLASRLRSVDTNTGGGSLLLNSVAAAVIGGTSLFWRAGQGIERAPRSPDHRLGRERHGPAGVAIRHQNCDQRGRALGGRVGGHPDMAAAQHILARRNAGNLNGQSS